MEKFLTARAVSGSWNNDIKILLKQRSGNGVATAEPIVMQTREEGELYQPSFRLKQHQAQVLMDDLWHTGLRPTEGTGSAGALAATERHLEDMKKIVFKNYPK
jgi:hypothetical protein